jgi:hypothetical protein
VPSTPQNEGLLRQPSHSPLPKPPSYNNPLASGDRGGPMAFFSNASGFQLGAFNLNMNSADDLSFEGTSIH